MSAAQLRLVSDMPQVPRIVADPTRRVFEHWMAMFGKSPNRCKMGRTRRGAINDALATYDLDQVLMAIEGAAADPWVAGDNPMRRPCDDVEWLLANESRIERFSEVGERLRERVQQQIAATRTAPAQEDEPEDPAAAAEALERMRRMAARLSGRGQ